MKNNSKKLSLKTIAFALALSGAAALIYEVVATDVLFYYFENNTYSVATVLSTFLLGLALGSLFISKYLNRVKSKPFLFTIFQFVIGLYALFILTNFNLIPHYLSFITGVIPQGNLFLATFSKFMVGILYLILPTFLFGASFPLAASIIIKKVKEAGQNVGVLYSWDLFGSIAGTLAAGFLIMPLAGLKAACFFGGGLNFLSGFLVFKKDKKINLALATLIFAVFIFSYFLIDPLNEKKIIVKTEESNNPSQEINQETYKEFQEKDIIYQTNSPYGVLHIIDTGEDRMLSIDHKVQCATSSKAERTMADIALSNIEGENLKVLIIGLGCGFTLDSFLKYNEVRAIDMVEINPKIPEITTFFFGQEENPLNDERVNLVIEDGFQYLQKTDKMYDIISIDIQSPSVAHSSPLYTVEAFRLASQVLKYDGLFEIYGFAYGPTLEREYDYIKIFYYSLKQSFPYVCFPRVEGEPLVFLASSSRLEKQSLTDEEREVLEKLKNDKDVTLNTMNYPILKYRYGGD